MAQFIERRKQYRLPFEDKAIFTDGKRSFTSYASNLSKGGLFVTSLEPFPIETTGHLVFSVPEFPYCLSLKAKVAHIVFDRQRCEVENGMGFMFLDVPEEHQRLIDNHLLNQQEAFQELKVLLAVENPNAEKVGRCLTRVPSLRRHDLLALRYRVNRICTLFEPEPLTGTPSLSRKAG